MCSHFDINFTNSGTVNITRGCIDHTLSIQWKGMEVCIDTHQYDSEKNALNNLSLSLDRDPPNLTLGGLLISLSAGEIYRYN